MVASEILAMAQHDRYPSVLLWAWAVRAQGYLLPRLCCPL